VIVVESEKLRVTIDSLVGGTITAVEHIGLGKSVLGTVPWKPEAAPPKTPAAPDEQAWLPYYTGGWPVLFPNGGNACEFDGVFHGFHGEASLAPWEAQVAPLSVRLKRRFESVPVEMLREIGVEGELVTVRETARMLGEQPIKVMWGHHPTFGSDLLGGPFAIETGACNVTADDQYDPGLNPLKPGASARWPVIAGKNFSFDLSSPGDHLAAMAYLHDFESAWASIRRLDNSIAAALSWDLDIFPFCWLWLELGGTPDAPWNGKARLIGLEPNTTWPGNGLADAARRGAPLLTLKPGAHVSALVRLHVFEPEGRIAGVDANGYALSNAVPS